MTTHLKKLFSTLFVVMLTLMFTSTVTAQWQWVKKGNRTDDNNGVYTHDIAVDASNNGIIGGYYCGTSADQCNFDGTLVNGYGSAFHYSGFIAKYNAAGTIQWMDRIGSGNDGHVEIKGVTTDASGNVFACGYFERTTRFGGLLNADAGGITKTSVYSGDGFIAKYNSAGVFQWVSVIAAAATPQGSKSVEGIRVSNNAIYVVGTYNAKIDFGGGITLTSLMDGASYSTDIFIAKYDLSGNCIWANSAGSSKTDYGYGLALDPSENIFISGNFQSTATFGSINVTTGAGAGSTNSNSFLAKYNSSGTCQWVKQGWSISSQWNYHFQIAMDNNNDLYITSGLNAGESINFGSSITNSGTVASIFVTKITNAGVHSWTQQYTASGAGMTSYGISAYGNSVFVSGNFNGTAPFGGYSQTSTGSLDLFLLKINRSTGAAEASAKAGATGSGQNYFSFLANDSNGDLLVGGSCWGVGVNQTFGAYPIGLVRNTGYIAKMLFCIPVSITGQPSPASATICAGNSQLYSVTATGSATISYQWQLNGGDISGATGSSYSATAAGSYTCVVTNSCGTATTTAVTLSVTSAPATPGAITGNTPVCPGTSQNYSISAVPGATGYNWSVPAGWIITGGTGSTGITVTAGSAGQNGNVSVTAANSCFTSAASILPVVVSPATPATPGAISGLTPVCPGTSQTYTISSVPDATTYTWNVPAGWIITGGAGSASLTVTAGSAGQNGNITVTAGNTCGTSAASILPVVVSPATPATPGAISGLTPVCPGTSQIYTISTVPNANTYTWNVPAGWIITAGAGSTSLTVAAGSAGQNGNITVTAGNTCGTSAASTLAVVVSPAVPATPGAITGLTPVCPGTSQTYTISTVPNANTYTWNVPAGWNITGGAGSASLTVTAGSAGQNGNITVTAGNTCGTSAASILPVVVSPATPATPGAITGLTPVCPGTSQTYTISSVPDAITYTWNVPAGWIITGGAGSTSLTVTAGSAGQNGNITVTAGNTCGTSAASILAVVVSPPAPAAPGAITGSPIVCPGSSGLIYSITGVADASTYTWMVPAGWSINAGAGTTTISVTAGTAGQNGTITVTAGNTCGTSTASTLNVSVTATVAASLGISASANPVCEGTLVTFTAAPVNGGATPTYQWYLNGSPTGAGGDTYSNNALTNSNQVYCIMTTSELCATGSPSTSNTVIMAIDALSVAPTSVITSVNPICNGSSSLLTVQGGSLGTGANWMWYSGSCGGTSIGTGNSITVSPSGDSTYYALAQGTCNTTPCTSVTLNVTDVSAVASGDQTICTSDSATLSVSGTGSFTWSYLGLTTPSITVTPGGTTTYTVTAVNGTCTATDAVTVNVTSQADATITSAGPYCTGLTPLTLTALNPGGTWTGDGITNGTTGLFNPALAGIGPHDIIYTISGSCGDSDTITLTVNASVDATITPAGPYCSNAPAVILPAATAGGTWSGPGITNTSTGLFNPAVSGSGSFDVIYTIAGACGDADTISIVVNPAANATVTPAGPFCIGALPLDLTALNAGGTWSGDGITNAANGTFDPSVAGIGTHPITYIISGVCADTGTISVVVNTIANAAINPAGPYCSDVLPVTLTAVTSGGSWSGQGITNTATGQFSPGTVGAGSYDIVYTISGSCGDSDTLTIVVNTAHNANINPAGPFCETGNFSYLTSVETGGTWSGTGITSAISGSFDPAVAGPGTHDIVYTISGTCGDSDTIQIVVNALANTEILSTGPFCNNLPAFNLSAATPGGIWSGAGITNTATGAFNPGLAGVGMHTIIYIVTGACGNSDTVSVVVNPSPAATSTAINETCLGANNGTATTTVSGGTAPYSYLWENAATSSSISALAPGQYAVIITDANGCADADTAYVSAATVACETIIPAVYIPNAFSPNGDGNNDVLFVRGQGISTLDIRIYDRWGEKVFETSELSNGWDGTFKGKMMDQGVFVYTMYVQFTDGTVKDDKGNITLFK